MLAGAAMTAPVWTPGAERVTRANLTRFLAHVRTRAPAGAESVWDVPSLYAWVALLTKSTKHLTSCQ